MEEIMGMLEPIISTITGIFGGEGGEGFDPATIIDTIKGFIESIIGGIA